MSMENPASIDFRLQSDENDYGESFENTNRIAVYLRPHECLESIFSTIEHEVLHKCLSDILDNEIDIVQDNQLIKMTLWGAELA